MLRMFIQPVLEFVDGRMETAKKPLPRPAKAGKKSTEEKSATEMAAEISVETPTGELPQAEAVDASTETIPPAESPPPA